MRHNDLKRKWHEDLEPQKVVKGLKVQNTQVQ